MSGNGIASNRYDVAIVGAGPVGLILANLLGTAGVSTVIIEQNASTVQEPRAVTIDDETLRTIQAAGLFAEAAADIALDCGSYFLGPDGRAFAFVHPTSQENGFPRRSSFSQPLLEATLRRGLDRFPNVTTLFGHACVAVREGAESVGLTVRNGDAERALEASFVVGCDGGRSRIRETIGATLSGSSFAQRWLVIDLSATAEQLRQTRIFCDPRRPGITLPGPHGIRRYEFMLHEHENNADAESEAFVRRLLAAHGPDRDAPIRRSRVYAFHARVADVWRTRRIMIAGDAAHLSPPFGGLGMNSGVKDAHNLAWKLAAVVRGEFSRALLDTYSTERIPHATALVHTAVNIGKVMMPTSPVKAALIRNGLRLSGFIPPVQSYFAQMRYKPKPFYRAGYLVADEQSTLVGRLFPQPLLEMADGKRLLDDVVGGSAAFVAYGPQAEDIAAAASGRCLALGMVPVAVLPASHNPRPQPAPFAVGRDLLGRLAALPGDKAAFMALVRPDRIVAAAATSSTSVEAFMQRIATLRAGHGAH